MRWQYLLGPTALAAAVTLANAAKPVVVDDAAYLAFARHLAAHPLDPYGFELFWYDVPESAMAILLPPVLPYWLSLGIRLFGEHVVLLKLWLFPFVWLLAHSLHELLSRFAREAERPALVLLLLSPAILPTVNVMLDVPALALGLTALVLAMRATDRRKYRTATLAGLAMALAVQAKYTMLLVPAIALWYGLVRRRAGCAIAAAVVAAVAFSAWEGALYRKYGKSHFLNHARLGQKAVEAEIAKVEEVPRLELYLTEKADLIPPFFGFLGGLGAAIGLWGGRAVGFPRCVVTGSALLAALGIGLVVALPHDGTVFLRSEETGREKLNLASVVWRSLGAGLAVTASLAALLLLVERDRRPGQRGWRVRHSRGGLFLVGWAFIEIAGHFVLSPFPAGRRLIGTTVAVGILLARAVALVGRARPDRRAPGWIVPLGAAYGIAFWALDGYDAWVEKAAANRATAAVAARRDGGEVWYVGHWGFGYYCDRAGMRHYVPGIGRDVVRGGDWLVLPHYSADESLGRPFAGWSDYRPPAPGEAILVEKLAFDDFISGRTVPNFYGGVDPILGRARPRLVVGIYRVTGSWSAE